LTEEHKFFSWREFETGKLLQMSGCEERTSLKLSRETFLQGASGEI
jgi:hypothetical protein